MIFESRSLILSDEELVLAMRPLLESQGVSQNGPVTDVKVCLDSENEVSVTIEVVDQGSLEYSSRDVGVAVLNHCIEQGIPLPRGSYKELAIRGDHIALIVRLESGAISAEVDEGDE